MHHSNFSKRIIFTILLGLSFSLSCNLYAQNFYKWVDANGSTHYTQTPPPKGAKTLGAVNTINETPSGDAANKATAHQYSDQATMAARDAARAADEAATAIQLNNLKQPTAMAGPDTAAAEHVSQTINSKPSALSSVSR